MEPSRSLTAYQGSFLPAYAVRLAPGPRLRILSATPLLRAWSRERAVGVAMLARVPRRGVRTLGARDRPEALRGVRDHPVVPRGVEARGGLEEPRGPCTPLTKTHLVPCVWMTMPLFGVVSVGRASAQLTMVRDGALPQCVAVSSWRWGPEGLPAAAAAAAATAVGAARPRSRGAAPSGRPRRRTCPAFSATPVTPRATTTLDSIVNTVVRSSVRVVTTSLVPAAGWPGAVAKTPEIRWGLPRVAQRSQRIRLRAVLALATWVDQAGLASR